MKGCLLRLALLPLIAGALYPLLCLRAPWPTFDFQVEGAGVAAGVAGCLFWFAVMSVLDGRQIKRGLALAAEGRTRGFRSGEKAVAHGTLEARGPLLEAPFSGESCLGYYYKVDHYSTTLKSRQVDYEGCALAASAIQGPAGSFNLLAAPDKELFHELPLETVSGDEAYARAEGFLSGAGLVNGGDASGRKRETVAGPGDFRVDTSTGTQPSLGACDLHQKIVRAGDPVSLAGVYEEEGAGIAPDPDTIMRPLHIVPGGEKTLRRKIRSRRVGTLVSTVLGLLVVAIYLLVLAPRLS